MKVSELMTLLEKHADPEAEVCLDEYGAEVVSLIVQHQDGTRNSSNIVYLSAQENQPHGGAQAFVPQSYLDAKLFSMLDGMPRATIAAYFDKHIRGSEYDKGSEG